MKNSLHPLKKGWLLHRWCFGIHQAKWFLKLCERDFLPEKGSQIGCPGLFTEDQDQPRAIFHPLPDGINIRDLAI